MGKRKAEDDEWELFKDEILTLYNQHPLAKVMLIMDTKGFKRTKAQYERRLKGWQDGARKNITTAEWRYIIQKLESREKDGKNSALTVRGFHVPQSRISKQGKVHAYKTAIQRYAPEEQAATPPGVEVYTPRENSTILEPHQSALHLMEQLPYMLFTGRLDQILSSFRKASFPVLSLSLDPSPSGWPTKSKEAPSTLFLETMNMKRYLPRNTDSGSGDGHQNNSDLVVKGSQLELLKHVIGLVSNDHHSESLNDTLEKLAEDPQNLKFLGRLLSMNQNTTNAFAEKLLLWTIREKRNPALVKILISFGADVNHIDSNGQSLLGNACKPKYGRKSEERMVALSKALLDAGADINYQDADDSSPLHAACQAELYELVELLLEHGADPNCQDEYGETSLHVAIEAHNSEIVELLLEHGADVNLENLLLGYTALDVALEAQCGDDILSMLLDRGAEYGDKLPLMLDMVEDHSYGIAERLIIASVSCLSNPRGFIIDGFVHAAFKGNVDVLHSLARLQPGTFEELKQTPWLLFEAAAYLDRREPETDKWGLPVARRTKLSYVHAIAVMDYLQNHGFDITAVDNMGKGNPIVYAALCGPIQLTQYLLDAGLRIDGYANGSWMRDHLPRKGCLGFENAKIRPDPVIRGLLLARDTEIAPIHAAAMDLYEQDLQLDIMQLLLEEGADPNQFGTAYPIQIASWSARGSACTVKALLEAGANPHYTNPRGIQIIPNDNSESPIRDSRLWFPLPNALHLASSRANLKIFKSLIGSDAVFVDPHVPWLCICYVDPPYPPPERICNGRRCWNALICAADKKDEELFSLVLARLSPAEQVLWLTTECFSKLVTNFDWKFVVQVVGSGTFSKDFSQKNLWEFFIRAIREKDAYLVSGLIKEKILSRRDIQYGFVLATQLGWSGIAPIFLEAGCWPDTIDWNYHSPLGEALRLEDATLIHDFRELYENHPNLAQDSVDSVHFAQAYAEAIKHGHMSLAQVLKGGTSLDIVRYEGFHSELDPDSRFPTIRIEIHSSLQLAIAFEQHDTTQWLLDAGADPNIPSEGQINYTAYHSPLQCAAKNGKMELVKDLIKRGADVNDTPIEIQGATAFQFAAILGNFEMVNVLLNARADINASPSSWEGRSAIEGAAEWGRLDMVHFLLEAGADVQGRTNMNYRKTVYRAWVHGHRVLARAVQRWKEEKYGAEDCESIEAIIDSMDLETLEQHEPQTSRPPGLEICWPCENGLKRSRK